MMNKDYSFPSFEDNSIQFSYLLNRIPLTPVCVCVYVGRGDGGGGGEGVGMLHMKKPRLRFSLF